MKSPLESHQQKCSQGELSSLVPVSGSLDIRDAPPSRRTTHPAQPALGGLLRLLLTLQLDEAKIWLICLSQNQTS